jgi:molybdopterin synthase catalytic subunit
MTLRCFRPLAEDEPLIKIDRSDFDVDEEVRQMKTPSVGGIVTFVGTVRGESEGEAIDRMDIEIYPEMAEKQLRAIRDEAIQKFQVKEVKIIHRFGELRLGDNIVLIAVAAGHRAEAFEACRYAIDELKKRVPIWKREHTSSGDRWVEVGRPENS